MPRTQIAGEKREASASPGSEVDEAELIGARRSVKAQNNRFCRCGNWQPQRGQHLEEDKSCTDVEKEDDVELSVAPLKKRITREVAKKDKVMADFSKLKASRDKKRNGVSRTAINDVEISLTQKEDKSDGSDSSERREKYFGSLVTGSNRRV